MEPANDVDVREVRFPCPFCRRGVVAGMGLDAGRPGVAHARPLCPQFVQMDPRVFLSVANDRQAAELDAQKRSRARKETIGVMGYAAGGAIAGFLIGGPVGAAFGGLFAAAARRAHR